MKDKYFRADFFLFMRSFIYPAALICSNVSSLTMCSIQHASAAALSVDTDRITKGTTIFVRIVAPFGDPMEITLRGYELTLNKADADMIAVV